MLVFWESENRLFREEFYRTTHGISRARTECEYVTESTEFHLKVNLNVKRRSPVIQEGIEGNAACSSGNITGQFY